MGIVVYGGRCSCPCRKPGFHKHSDQEASTLLLCLDSVGTVEPRSPEALEVGGVSLRLLKDAGAFLFPIADGHVRAWFFDLL